MRPRLASLALLLLALCRSASATAAPTGWGATVTDEDSDVTLSKATKDNQAAKLIAEYAATTDLTKLEEVFGNSLHALLLKGKDSAKFDALPEYYKKALVNGVQCELAVAGIEKTVATALYGAADGKVPAAQIPLEQGRAKLIHGIDCADTTKADPCLCTATKENPLIYCLAKKHFPGAPGVACKKAVSDELKNFGKKALWKQINNEISSPPSPADKLAAVTGNESPEMANVFCDAIDPAVLAITEKLYASDGLLWTQDSSILLKQGTTVDEDCEKDEVKNAALGKCMCSKKTGFSVCATINMGTLFKNKGYLDCAPTPAKFDSAKKDSVKADLQEYMDTGDLPSSNPAPGPGGPTAAPPAGGNETTTAATGGAATSSSLLLAPLAAAAAAVLLL